MSERKELVNELLVTFMLVAVIAVSSYITVDALTGDKASEYLKSIKFNF